MKRLLFLTLVTMLLAEPVFAADIATDVRSGSGVPDNSNGGYFEVGLSATYANDPFEDEDDDDNDNNGGLGRWHRIGWRLSLQRFFL